VKIDPIEPTNKINEIVIAIFLKRMKLIFIRF